MKVLKNRTWLEWYKEQAEKDGVCPICGTVLNPVKAVSQTFDKKASDE